MPSVQTSSGKVVDDMVMGRPCVLNGGTSIRGELLKKSSVTSYFPWLGQGRPKMSSHLTSHMKTGRALASSRNTADSIEPIEISSASKAKGNELEGVDC